MARRAESITNDLLRELIDQGGVDVLQSRVIVTEPADLSGVLDPAKVYFIDGEIDMGSTSIIVPEGGLTLQGLGFNVSSIISDQDSFDLFVSPSGGRSGDLVINGIELAATGTGSQVFNLDNDENLDAVEIVDCNFSGCTKVGLLDSYRQFFMTGAALIRCLDGIEFAGNMAGGVSVTDSIILELGTQFQGSVLKAGTGLVIGDSVRSNANGLALTGGSFCDFAPANITIDGGFQMIGTRMPVGIDAFPNMPSTSVKARFRDTQGTPKTYPGATCTITTQATTAIATASTFVEMAGIATYSELVWFSEFGDNGFEYDSAQEIDVLVDGALEFTGGNNDQMAVQVWKYTAADMTWAAISPEFKATLNGGAAGVRAENLSFGAFANLIAGDRIQLRVANLSDTTDIVTAVGGQIRIRER